MRIHHKLTLLAATLAAVFNEPAHAQVESAASAAFVNFESGPVRPVQLSADGARLFVLNTADHRLEVYSAPGLEHITSIFTGLDPVSIALHPGDADVVFVSNHLSDSVAVVDLADECIRDVIYVGDEPRGLVVAQDRLFVAVARDADPQSPDGILSNYIHVSEAQPPYARLARIPVEVHTPRDLVTDGNTVYVIPQNSGNHTTVLAWPDSVNLVGDQTVLDAHDLLFNWTLNPALTSLNLQLPEAASGVGWAIPETARIVFDHEFPAQVTQLADRDIVSIDAVALAPGAYESTGIGTTLFGIEPHPTTGDFWVVCTEALNRTRMEYNLKGAAFENRVVVVDGAGAVTQTVQLAPPVTSVGHAQPVALAFYEGDGSVSAYVAALGSASVVVLDASAPQTVLAELAVGDLPSGLAIDSGNAFLYVFTRGDKQVRAYNIDQGHTLHSAASLPYDPEPPAVADGRIHLYDARSSTGHGADNFSCASCHVFGHLDQLAWDLGDSSGSFGYLFPDLIDGEGSAVDYGLPGMNPLKGPMTTQSLRGVADDLPLHWRGDRRFVHQFQGAFEGLNGGSGIQAEEMQAFAAFLDYGAFPPNPISPKDREYKGQANLGRRKFGVDARGLPYNPEGNTCTSCHPADFATDFKGARKELSRDGRQQLFNPATMRGVYEKEFKHITGFGLSHTGRFATLREFLNATRQSDGQELFVDHSFIDRKQIAGFLQRWDTGYTSQVGRQITVTQANLGSEEGILDLWEQQAEPPVRTLDLIFKSTTFLGGGGTEKHGAVYAFDPSKNRWRYQFDSGQFHDRDTLIDLVGQGAMQITFMAVPPKLGVRLGVDRDEDGLTDWQELEQFGTSPSNPDSDADGFDDALELAAGADPLSFDLTIADVTAPTILPGSVKVRAPFTTTATLGFVLNEPARALIEAGTSPGLLVPVAFGSQLRARHDLSIAGLPPGQTIHYRITATDQSGNTSAPFEGSFETAPPLYHVESMSLSRSGLDPITLSAQVWIADEAGLPVVGIPVRGMWHSANDDLAGNDWIDVVSTGGDGRAVFQIELPAPAGTDDITFTVLFAGSSQQAHPFYVGDRGSMPTFYYFQPANKANFVTLTIP